MTLWLIIAALWVAPMWMILPRSGLNRWWSLAAIIPAGGLVLLWVLAMRRWPGDDLPGRFE